MTPRGGRGSPGLGDDCELMYSCFEPEEIDELVIADSAGVARRGCTLAKWRGLVSNTVTAGLCWAAAGL
jgi:hypothetical protein